MFKISVSYNGDGVRRTWPVPFPYGSAADIGVKLLDSEGAETELEQGSGWKLVEHSVICEADEGERLFIWLKTPLARALYLQEERVRAAEAAGVNEAASAWHAQAAAQIAEEAAASAEARAASVEAELSLAVDALASKAQADVQAVLDAGVATAAAAREAALAEIWAAAKEAISRAANPGISAIPLVEDLARYSQGFFVINPFLQAGTSFMGMWPVAKPGAILWDGFFVLIPDCPGHDKASNWNEGGWNRPLGPGQTPGQNESSDPSAGYSWWLSCKHEHASV